MIKDDHTAQDQSSRLSTATESANVGEGKKAKFTFVQRVLREAGIGIALLLMIVFFAACAPHFTDE
jgi:hypothetical protein